MSDKTMLVLPGKRMPVPRAFKRTLQVATAVVLTAAVALALMLGSGLLQARGSILQAVNVWIAFINRPDIQATMVLTALVTVMFIYWQRDKEKR